MLRDGQRAGDVLHVGQQRQVVLLTVAESLGLVTHTGYEQRGVGGQLTAVHVERGRGGTVGLHANVKRLFVYHALILRVEELQTSRSTYFFIGGVEDTGRDDRLVAMTQESRHVGLHHDLLAGNGLAVNHAAEHFLRMGGTHEAPCGETFRQGEAQGHMARAVGGELRHEESRLIEVLTHLYLLISAGVSFFLYSLHFVGRSFIHDHLLQACRLSGVIFYSLGQHHRLILDHHAADSSAQHIVPMRAGYPP